jgi:nucleotide-binding universal stress UspA family protein
MRKTGETDQVAAMAIARGPSRIVIPFTSSELTREALRVTAEIAGVPGGVTVTVLAVQVVPYPLPLDRPDVEAERLLARIAELAGSRAIHVQVLLALARDGQRVMRSQIPPGALVVLATRRRWWKTREESLARVLVRDGHRVVLLLSDEKSPVACWSSSTHAPLRPLRGKLRDV